jgi:2-oxoglutarate ferredoxin oxidoreductase subunit alpha
LPKFSSVAALHVNAYQTIIRGANTFLTIRAGSWRTNVSAIAFDLLIPLNQDSIDRHLRLQHRGSAVIYTSDTIQPGAANDAVQLCPLPVNRLSEGNRSKVAQNTLVLVPAHQD